MISNTCTTWLEPFTEKADSTSLHGNKYDCDFHDSRYKQGLPQGDYFLWVLMFDIFADWPKNANFCTRKSLAIFTIIV